MKRFLFVLLLSLIACDGLVAQDSTWNSERAFGDYLLANGLYQDATLQLQKTAGRQQLSAGAHDSLYHQLGRCFEQTGQPDSARRAYGLVSAQSPFYKNAACGMALIDLRRNDYATLFSDASAMQEKDSTLHTLRLYNSLGAALLRNDTATFRKTLAAETMQYGKNSTYAFLEQQEQQLRSVKHKSPFVAGALSAIVPGLGKVYAGKPRHGVAAFFPCAILGVQAAEAYYKGGWKDPRFIAYTSLFSVFYLGNIYGSALTVRVQRQETIDNVHYAVQADLRLALERNRH